MENKTTEQLKKELEFLKSQIGSAKSYELGELVQRMCELVYEIKKRSGR